MADCPRLAKCPFFNDQMADMPSMAGIIKQRYCRTDNTHCARFMVAEALGPEAVPSDLYPSQVDRAKAILEGRA